MKPRANPVYCGIDTTDLSVAAKVVSTYSDATTALEGMVKDGSVAARGRPFALRARMTQGEAESERVRAEYRVSREGDAGDRAGREAVPRLQVGIVAEVTDVLGGMVESTENIELFCQET